MRPKSETNCIESANTLKPGLHISRKGRKHMVGKVYFKMYGYSLLSLSLEWSQVLTFHKKLFNRYPDSLKQGAVEGGGGGGGYHWSVSQRFSCHLVNQSNFLGE